MCFLLAVIGKCIGFGGTYLDANVCLAIQVGEDAVFIGQATKAGLGTERACSCGGTKSGKGVQGWADLSVNHQRART
jgi:hypothetical protein